MKQPVQSYQGLKCTDCQSFFDDKQALGRCPSCGGLLDTVIDENALAQYSKNRLGTDRTMWRFRMFMPIVRKTEPVTAGEGGTPLRILKHYSHNVMVKDETRNPTGTFKDRGASLAVTQLSYGRVRKLVLASEGNAGCSFALYSQIAGIGCHIYLPKQANPAKVRLSRKLGALVDQVRGTIGDAGKYAASLAGKMGQYNASSFVTPFRHDGKGTIALEICEQLEWQAPDFVVYPVGGGVGLIGMWKMFKILQRIGWTRSCPRFIAVQPSGCAPVVEAYNRGREDCEVWKHPRTIAQGLMIPRPLASKWILRTLRESRAIALRVSEREIRKAADEAARNDGMILEPSSATAFATLPGIYEAGVADKGDRIVVIATGSGLKTLDNA